MSLFQSLLEILPVKKNKIVFINFLGRGWGDNPKYIAAELLRQNNNLDLVWLVSDKNTTFPRGIRAVKFFSRRCRFELATAKVIVSNVKANIFPIKKNDQYYIQTWHGDFPLKFIEKEAEDTLSAEYLELTKSDSEKTDLILSGSAFFSDIIKESFWYDGEILESGLPRNDLFFESNSKIPQKIRMQLGIPPETAIALYAPTFRDHGEFFPFPDFQTILGSLNQHTRQNWVFIVRLHPNDQKRANEILYSSKIINGSVLDDMQELEKAADLLITDYSSVMYDFALQQKPVILYTPDLEEYRTACRNLRPLYDELPFIRTSSDSELQKAIPLALSEDYKKRVDSFLRERVRYFDDGHASERVVERINKIISNKGRAK